MMGKGPPTLLVLSEVKMKNFARQKPKRIIKHAYIESSMPGMVDVKGIY